MESLYLLIPLSLVLVLAIAALLAWAVLGGQFDNLEDQGRRVLEEDEADEKLANDARSRAAMHDDEQAGRSRLM